MDEPITIRIADIADAPHICEINQNALGYDFSLPETKAQLSLLLSRTTDKVLVAVCQNEVRGYIHAADYECTYCAPMKNVMALAVDISWQGRGIGRRLLEAAGQWAHECGCAGVRLISGTDRTDAHRFYLGCGYMVRKTHKNFVKLF